MVEATTKNHKKSLDSFLSGLRNLGFKLENSKTRYYIMSSDGKINYGNIEGSVVNIEMGEIKYHYHPSSNGASSEVRKQISSLGEENNILTFGFLW